jgi:uncharacterized membrane protein YbhN (UPF0104 family)
MSFGGSVAAMIISIKNNSRRHKRKSAFEGRGELAENKPLRFKSDGKMSKKELAQLGAKTARINRFGLLKAWVVSLIVLACIAAILYYGFIHLAQEF